MHLFALALSVQSAHLVRSYPLLVVLLWALPTPARAGRLQDVEDTARDVGASEPERSTQKDTHEDSEEAASSDSSQSGDDPWIAKLLLAPWFLPKAIVDDPCYTRFAPYPYADGAGNLRPWHNRRGCSASEGEQTESRSFAAQMDFEGSYLLTEIVAGTVAARLQLPYRLELSGRLSLLQDLVARPHEQALAGTTHLSVRFAQSRHVEFRTGLGLRAFGLHQPLFGADLLYGMDVFGRHPIMAHIELHLGNLARALSGQARITLGVQFWKIELYAGYDHTVYGSSGRSARLGGPVAGLRAWF